MYHSPTSDADIAPSPEGVFVDTAALIMLREAAKEAAQAIQQVISGAPTERLYLDHLSRRLVATAEDIDPAVTAERALRSARSDLVEVRRG